MTAVPTKPWRLAASTIALALAVTLSALPIDSAEGTTHEEPGSGDWIAAMGTFTNDDGFVRYYEVRLAPDGRYWAFGEDASGFSSEAVFFDGGQQTVVFRAGPNRSVETFENDLHFAVSAVRAAEQSKAAQVRLEAQPIDLGYGAQFAVDLQSVQPIRADLAEVDFALGLHQAARIHTQSGIEVSQSSSPAYRSGDYVSSSNKIPLGGQYCIRAYRQYRYSDARAYAYSRNLLNTFSCYWVSVSLWEGYTIGGAGCNSLYWLGSGSAKTSTSSVTGWVNNPPPWKDAICSAHAGWSQNWILYIAWEGFTLWV